MENRVIASFETKNGLLVQVRPLLPEDVPHLVEIFARMGADSRYLRFNQPAANVAPERVWLEAESIAHLEPQIGFIAFVDLPEQSGVPIGAARCVCLGDGVAETAVSVCDEMQNQGVATNLLAILAEEAKKQGVRKLVATVQSVNRPMIHILNRMPYACTRKTIGPDTELELDLTVPKPEIAAEEF